MRRFALALATVGLLGAGMAGGTAQAHEGWGYYRDHGQHEQVWRGHHTWRAAPFHHHALFRIVGHLFR